MLLRVEVRHINAALMHLCVDITVPPLTQQQRLRLVILHLRNNAASRSSPLTRHFFAEALEHNLRCAFRWLARYRSGSPATLFDRHSVRHNQRQMLNQMKLQHACISDKFLVSWGAFSTVVRALNPM